MGLAAKLTAALAPGLFVLALLLGVPGGASAACPGDTGQTGPTGATGPTGPAASTQCPTNVTFNSAELNGIVNPNGQDTWADFEYGPGGSTAPQSVGAGIDPTLASASVTGLAPGTTYSYRIVATDSFGDTATGGYVTFTTLPPPPPTAAFNPTQATVLTGSPVGFDGTPSSDPAGSITSYGWNFGDGGTASASQPGHTYSQPGTYNVSLAVTDNYGLSSSVTHQITVIAPPPVQTLIESIIAAPIVVKFAPPAVARRALVDLGERLFCPGTGPVCQTTITETTTGLAREAHAAASTVLSTPANGNAELALHLSPAQWKALLQKHRLSFALKLVAARGGETVTNALRFKLTHRG